MGAFIRPVRPEEYAAVSALTVGAYVGDGFVDADADYVAELGDTAGRAAGAEVLVAVEDGGVLGSVTSCPAGSPYRELAGDGEGEFRMLSVAASARGRGLGEALVRECLARSRAAGDRGMVICSMAEMTAAHRLYERLGFLRSPADDWSPHPGVRLLGFRLAYGATTRTTVPGSTIDPTSGTTPRIGSVE